MTHPPAESVFPHITRKHEHTLRLSNTVFPHLARKHEHTLRLSNTGACPRCRNYDIIERFGRFPDRNANLGRRSTPEEAQYLAQSGGGAGVTQANGGKKGRRSKLGRVKLFQGSRSKQASTMPA